MMHKGQRLGYEDLHCYIVTNQLLILQREREREREKEREREREREMGGLPIS